MAELITLSGDYSLTNSRYGRRRHVNYRAYELDELMGGVGDFFKSAGTLFATPFVAPARGIGKTVMEFGRGAKDLDFLRMAAAPFKGAVHTSMISYRASKDYAEWYWRPSKMRQWQGVGAALCTSAGTIAMATGPGAVAAPALLACGAALGVSAGVAENIYQSDEQKKAKGNKRKQDELNKEAQKKYMLAAVGVIGAGVLITMVL